VNRFERILEGLRHEDALARREAVGLDDDGSALFAHIGEGGSLVMEGAIGGGGQVIALHEVLGEGLAPLELRTACARTEAGDARLTHHIGDTGDERGLGAYHHEADLVRTREIRHGPTITDIERHIGRDRRRAAVTGSDEDGPGVRGCDERDGHRVFATTGAQDEDVHVATFLETSGGPPGVEGMGQI